jgi:hypothetical protein
MSTRLHVVIAEEEVLEYRRLAAREGLTLGERVRRTLREARRRKARPTATQRLRALERALRCGHPTGSVEEMLGQIQAGRRLP